MRKHSNKQAREITRAQVQATTTTMNHDSKMVLCCALSASCKLLSSSRLRIQMRTVEFREGSAQSKAKGMMNGARMNRQQQQTTRKDGKTCVLWLLTPSLLYERPAGDRVTYARTKQMYISSYHPHARFRPFQPTSMHITVNFTMLLYARNGGRTLLGALSR